LDLNVEDAIMKVVGDLRLEKGISWLVALQLLGFGLPAVAEQATIEEVIVTAQRRESNLQSTPISITAFSEDAIQALGFRQSVDITAQTPNYSVGYPNGDTGVPAPFIRGVGLNDFGVLNQGPIASYNDETYISSNAGQIFQLLDVERVEVLRGPQGTLYGRNATGGAVNFVSRKPTQEWDGWARAGTGSFGATKAEAAFGGGLSDTTAFRVAVLKSDSDGWLKNRFTGNDQQGVDELAYRVLFDITPSEDLSVLLNFHGGKSESDSVQYGHLGVWDALGNMCGNADILAGNCVDILGYSKELPYTTLTGVDLPATPGYDEGSYDFEAQNDTSFWGASATVKFSFGEYQLTSISSYDEVDDFRPEETDAGPNDLITGELAVIQETYSQELRLAWDSDDWTWLAGAYYLKDEATDRSGFDILRVLRPSVVGDDVNCSAPVGNPGGFCPEQFIQETKSGTQQTITSLALYFDTTVDLSSDLKLSLGIRYTDESIDHDSFFFFDEQEAGFPAQPGFPAQNSKSFQNVSGRILFDYQLSDSVLLYGGVTSGFKAGGIQSTSDGAAPYDEEQLISYEGGFKTTLANGSIRFNGSVFYYDYSDLQVFAFVVVNGVGFSTISNAADAGVTGAEFELQWLPTENLFVNLGVGLLDAEYDDFIISQGDFSGNTIPMSPDMNLNGLVQYAINLDGKGIVTLQTDFSYQDDVSFDALNNPLLSQEAYWLWNARVSWTSPGDHWEVAAFGRNLADEQFLVYGFDLSFFGFNEEMLGTPRAYGIDVTYRL
jgi:iron complex outermembrane receptor protein